MSLAKYLIDSILEDSEITLIDKSGKRILGAEFKGYQCVDKGDNNFVHTPVLNVPGESGMTAGSTLTLLDLEKKGFKVEGLPPYVETDAHREELAFMKNLFNS